MKLYIFYFVSLFFFVTTVNGGNDDFKCEEPSGMGKVTLDKNTGLYHQGLFTMGELGYYANFKECFLIDSTEIELSGIFDSENPIDCLITPIFLCKEIAKFEFEIKDTLSVTDNNGHFRINAKIGKDDLFIIFKEKEDEGIIFSLNCTFWYFYTEIIDDEDFREFWTMIHEFDEEDGRNQKRRDCD